MQEPAPSRARWTRMGDVSVEYQERTAARRFVRDAIGVGLALYYRQVEELPLPDHFTALLLGWPPSPQVPSARKRRARTVIVRTLWAPVLGRSISRDANNRPARSGETPRAGSLQDGVRKNGISTLSRSLIPP